MKTLTLTVGLPRSGKSTWARDQAAPIVNPDSVRLALYNRAFIPECEGFVWAITYVMARALLWAGHDDVIVDATNITEKRRESWRTRFSDCNIVLEKFDTSKEECVERARRDGREYLIPVIEKMAKEMREDE